MRRAIAAASRADHVIEKVRVFETLEEAIADLTLVYATTARRRDMQKPKSSGPTKRSQRITTHIARAGGRSVVWARALGPPQ
jgi:tRNA/rRNA methyltransferase